MSISEKQMKILAFSRTKYDALICDGAVRSGKTSLMAVGFFDWAMKNFNNTTFAVCGKTVASARRNIIEPYMAMSYAKKRYAMEFTRSDNRLVISTRKKKNTFYVFGGKDEASYKLIQGITLAGVLLDEVALMPRSFVEQALARCSIEGSKFWFNCNPSHPKFWFYEEWIQKAQEKNALHLHFLLEDNPSLSPAIIARYKSLYTGVFYMRYILGRWVRAEGVIYQQFADNTDMFVVKSCNEPLELVTIGIDYGAGKANTSFKATGFTHGFKKVYSLAERDIKGINSPDKIYAEFERFYLEIVNQYHRCNYVYADYGALGQVITNGLQTYMQAHGYPVMIRDCTKGTIIERIELTWQLMSEGRYKILSCCPNLISALQDAVWDEKHDDERLDDGTTDIDSLDAFEYSFFSYSDYLI